MPSFVDESEQAISARERALCQLCFEFQSKSEKIEVHKIYAL